MSTLDRMVDDAKARVIKRHAHVADLEAQLAAKQDELERQGRELQSCGIVERSHLATIAELRKKVSEDTHLLDFMDKLQGISKHCDGTFRDEVRFRMKRDAAREEEKA